MQTRRTVVGNLIVLAALAGALNARAATSTVSIVDFAFDPSVVTVTVGDTVRWTNNDGVPHTSTSETGVWNSLTIASGASYSRVFTSAGTFPYYCDFHQSMTATVSVEAPATTTTAAPTTTTTTVVPTTTTTTTASAGTAGTLIYGK